MHTKSLFAMTLLLVASQQLTACTIVDASDDDDTTSDEPDAATTSDDSDDTNGDETTDEGTNGSDGGATTSDDSDDADDTDVTSSDEDEDAGTSDTSDDTTAAESDEDGGDEGETPEGDASSDTTDSEQDDDAGPVGGDVFKGGSIGLTQSIAPITETVTVAASAGFSISTLGETPSQPVGELPCTTKTEGQCSLMECEFGTDAGVDPGEDTGSQSESVSAGAVKITGLTDDVTLTANDEGAYASTAGSPWTGGEALVASAPGSDEVPAFEIELTAPSTVTLTSPELSLLAPANASRTADFEVLWEDGDAGTVSLSIIDLDVTSTTRTITCSAPADSGGITVDASLLEDFSEQAMVSATIANTTTKTVEDWSLSFSATSTVGSGMVNFED